MEKVNLQIGGMSCASCANSIEKEVSHIEGVQSSNVNYAVESGNFEIESLKSTEIKESIEKKSGIRLSSFKH